MLTKQKGVQGSQYSSEQFQRLMADAKADVFDYSERFHNPKRRHSTIGYLSPVEFEDAAMLA